MEPAQLIIFTAGSTKKYILTNQVNQALNKCFLIVFNESWGKGRGREYQKFLTVDHVYLLLGFVRVRG